MPTKIACTVEHGNKAEKTKIKQSALQQMVDEIATLLDTASKLKSEDRMRDWFGKWNLDRNKSEISARLNLLIEYTNNATIEFKTREGRNGIAYADQKSDEPVIFLERPFRYKRIIWGEKVVSIVHELAHKCKMKARDLGSSYFSSGMSSSDCYGPKNAKELAAQNNDKALKNAENWGYFVSSHFKEAGLTKNRTHDVVDWKFGALSQGGGNENTDDDSRIVGSESKGPSEVEKKEEPPARPSKSGRPKISELKTGFK